MTGSGSGGCTGTGLLLGTGYLQLESKFGFVCTFDQWANGVPVIGFGDGTFSSWRNGAPYVDPGGGSVLPISATATCSGTAVITSLKVGTGLGNGACIGTGVLTGTGRLTGSGSGTCSSSSTIRGGGRLAGSGLGACSGTGILRGAGRLIGSGSGACIGTVSAGSIGILIGSGFGTSTGTGILTSGPVPTPISHRIISPRQPTLRHFDPVNDKWWSRRVSAGQEVQRTFG